MTRTAYVFVFLVIGLALFLHALDEKSDREGIAAAASIALRNEVTTACEKRNQIRDDIESTAGLLHPTERAAIRLEYENCNTLAKKAVEKFFRDLRAQG